MNVNPKGDYLLIDKIKEKSETIVGTIIIPNQGKTNLVVGKVLGAGDGTYESGIFVKNEIKEGDVVMFQDSASIPIQLDRPLIMIRAAYVLAMVDDIEDHDEQSGE